MQTIMIVVNSDLKITVLGSGTSHGVPMIACDCPVCTSDDPCDKRTRTSILVQFGPRSIIIDTAPVAPGTYLLYTTNLNFLSNDKQDFGGIMTEIVIHSPDGGHPMP